jgi:hypothetical protein
MTTEHTLGPWYSQPTAGHDIHGQSAIASEATGKTVAIAYDGKADARLLAAAPDLLLALQSLLAVTEEPALDELDNRQDIARAAIAKATGEPVMAA